MAHRHPLRRLLARQPEARHVAADRHVEIERAVLDEAERDRPGDRLRDRADLEQRRRSHLERVLDARDAETGGSLLAVGEQAQRDPGHADLLHPRPCEVDELLEPSRRANLELRDEERDLDGDEDEHAAHDEVAAPP
jgi:hypothetical protein